MESTATSDQISSQDNGNQTWKGQLFSHSVLQFLNYLSIHGPTIRMFITENSNAESMHKAALEGDWLAAEVVLARDSSLACDRITEEGDRALHVAAAKEHVEFVQKLVQRMSPSELALLDGHGYTACCYAAISGAVGVAVEMVNKNPNLGTARDKNGATPLHKAILHGNGEMVSYFLKFSNVEDLSREEWFDLLLDIIRSKMYDVGLELLEKDGSLATMRNEVGTALHELARQHIADVKYSRWRERLLDFFNIRADLFGERMFGNMAPDHFLLADKLWVEIQKLDGDNVLELIKNPPILHDATKVGNLQLVIMLIYIYPHLLWETDSNGYTIFHIAVMYRQENIFGLIHLIGATKHFIATSQDQNGNNILHLAAKLAHPDAWEIATESTVEMQRELVWFMAVEAIVPPLCLESRNKDGYTPQELFSEEHKWLQEKGETWMRNVARSCMLVATIFLTLVFTATFQIPGGNKQDTGIPIHLKSKWFTCFIIFEAVALFFSTLSITTFWSIMTSSFDEDRFMRTLPDHLKDGLDTLSVSLVASFTAFMSTYFLVFVGERAVLVKFVILSVYIVLLYAVSSEFDKISVNVILPEYLSKKLSRPMWRRRDMIRCVVVDAM